MKIVINKMISTIFSGKCYFLRFLFDHNLHDMASMLVCDLLLLPLWAFLEKQRRKPRIFAASMITNTTGQNLLLIFQRKATKNCSKLKNKLVTLNAIPAEMVPAQSRNWAVIQKQLDVFELIFQLFRDVNRNVLSNQQRNFLFGNLVSLRAIIHAAITAVSQPRFCFA